MAKVFLHCTDENRGDYAFNDYLEISRVPCVGDFVQPSADGEVYKVAAVLHVTVGGCDAEVWAGKCDHLHETYRRLEKIIAKSE